MIKTWFNTDWALHQTCAKICEYWRKPSAHLAWTQQQNTLAAARKGMKDRGRALSCKYESVLLPSDEGLNKMVQGTICKSCDHLSSKAIVLSSELGFKFMQGVRLREFDSVRIAVVQKIFRSTGMWPIHYGLVQWRRFLLAKLNGTGNDGDGRKIFGTLTWFASSERLS